ncbi:hypothetical protein JY68_11045 [Neisseria meningitidis]|nr:hypothetical protein A6J49_00935 [Neisseria meningitidis]MDM1032216.1 hypothetical protein [Neisseria meningitidis]PKT83141.1 hypothetical protein CWI50_12275 [Neisseria meningitidis]PKT84573.1 hypothetical protein CWI49_10885 [Neisseria meningitidis]PKT88944.1 hypothetical protein CWI59_02105 [Neisseria meningitidis]
MPRNFRAETFAAENTSGRKSAVAGAGRKTSATAPETPYPRIASGCRNRRVIARHRRISTDISV